MKVRTLLAAMCVMGGMTAAVPSQASESRATAPIVMAQAVSVEINQRPRVRERTVVRRTTVVRHRGPSARRAVIVRHDRGLHRGWRHAPAYGARRTTVIKKRGPLGTRSTTVIRERQ